MIAAIYDWFGESDGQNCIDHHLKELRYYARERDFQINEEYLDFASDGRADRPAFQRMLADASQRRFYVVLFWALERLSREGPSETLGYLTLLTAYGVGYSSVTEVHLNTYGMFRGAVMSIVATIAKQEQFVRAERHPGLGRAVGNGNRSGRGAGRPRVEVPSEAMELRRAGVPLREIARRFGVGATTIRRACKALSNVCSDPKDGTL